MSFNVGHTTFGFTMRVPETEAATVDDLFAAHAAWMKETHSTIEEEGKLHTLEYYVSKASELNDIVNYCKKNGIKIVCITSGKNSSLSKWYYGCCYTNVNRNRQYSYGRG